MHWCHTNIAFNENNESSTGVNSFPLNYGYHTWTAELQMRLDGSKETHTQKRQFFWVIQSKNSYFNGISDIWSLIHKNVLCDPADLASS